MAHSIANWQNIRSNREVLTTARGTTIEFDAPPQHMPQPSVSFSFEVTDIINGEIDKLLPKRIIKTTPHSMAELLSSIFVRPKKTEIID